MKKISLIFILCVSFFALGCKKNTSENTPAENKVLGEDPFWVEKNSAGFATSTDTYSTSYAYSYPTPKLTDEQLQLHDAGDALFEQNFSDDPSRPEYGLGPVYSNTSCIGCHNLDGRGSLPVGLNDQNWMKLEKNQALLLRISIENSTTVTAVPSLENHFDAPVAVPGYSTQLFHIGSYGLRGEGSSEGQAEVWLKLEKKLFSYPNGETVSLSKPIYQLRNPYDMYLDSITGEAKSRLWESDVKISPRMGMPMYGLGLLEMIQESDILAFAAIDRSAEGVYGKPNYVYDVVKAKAGDQNPISLGRFGVKANTPNLLQQAMAALNGDLGVTNPLFPIESIFGTPLYNSYVLQHPAQAKAEANDLTMKALTFYSQTLAVPPRRNTEDVDVIAGAKKFAQVSCTSCHTPSWQTGSETDIAAFKNQKIYPYTDMLIHDMGEGLSDDRKDFSANGRQWKTRALWGIGLTKVVNPRAGFLHDGRAQTLEEAILWHDGEAAYSRNKFANLSKAERQQLLKFLQSL